MSVPSDANNHRSSSAEHLAHLSNQVHSNSDSESHEALNELAKLGSNDAARALIESYRNSHWRDTRISIIRALGRNSSSRAIEFLLRLANVNFPGKNNEGKDTGICQETLLALGDTRDPVASTFLLQKLDSSPVYLRGWVVNALSRIPDLRASKRLHDLLESKESEEHPQLLRNAVIALSEMKDTSALQKFIEMLKQRTLNTNHAPDATALTLLSAIAQLSRNVQDILSFERTFDGEMLHRHFYQQCLTQVTFRQQWTLEDYLGKIFFSEKIHYSLPLELNSFAENDVVEALSIFATEEKHFHRLCIAIGSALNAENLLEKFIRIESLDQEQACSLLQNIVFLRSEPAKSILNAIANNQLPSLWKSSESSPLIAGWLRALVCVHEKPVEALCEWMDSETFRTSHERQRIEVINAFVNCCLLYRHESSWPKKQLQLLTELIHNETSTLVLGRWLRALGEIGLGELKWNETLLNRISMN
ncbi:HEAT repeat domain-containing protein, partial [bacterium]|nr:HEAT repeat domain-containing protein [bacterium]